MAFFEQVQTKERIYRHGGREVLRVSVMHVVGESCAAKHTENLVTTLAAYAEHVLFPRAKDALETALTNGTAYEFSAHRYRVLASEKHNARYGLVRLSTTLEAQGERSERMLDMYWTQDGVWQKRRHHQEW